MPTVEMMTKTIIKVGEKIKAVIARVLSLAIIAYMSLYFYTVFEAKCNYHAIFRINIFPLA